jgi:hypothetical protein
MLASIYRGSSPALCPAPVTGTTMAWMPSCDASF